MNERIPLVDESGNILGETRRSLAHGDPSRLHPVVHCLVLNSRDEILLQLRSMNKDIQPGRWDTSVGGHVDAGESIETALHRELEEELGVQAGTLSPRFLYRYVMRNEIESELVHTYLCQSDGPFRRQASEIDELRFWSRKAIRAALGTDTFTPNFEDEFARFEAVKKVGPGNAGTDRKIQTSA